MEFFLLHLSGNVGRRFRVDLERCQAVPTDDCMSDVTQLGACVADAVDATVLAREAQGPSLVTEGAATAVERVETGAGGLLESCFY